MSSLTIYKDDSAGSTVISNRFIDEYLADANDAQIKVYLYLVRMMSANLPVGVSDMADKFNHTEKDVMRSLKYWEKNHILSLEYNDAKVLIGIRFITPDVQRDEEPKRLAPIVPLKLVTEDPAKELSEEAPKPSYESISYSRDDLKKFKENPETSQLLFIAEMYLQEPLKLKDIEILYFIHYELNFSCELIDFLLQYCVEKGKKSFSYILAVALGWSDAKVTTPKQAKALSANRFDKEVYSILKLLGRTQAPTPAEANVVTKWYKDYGFSMDIITEACNRTVLATDSHRLEYCEKILSAWKTSGVKTLSDVSIQDASYKKPKASSSTSSTRNSFNTHIQADYNFAEIEKQLLSN